MESNDYKNYLTVTSLQPDQNLNSKYRITMKRTLSHSLQNEIFERNAEIEHNNITIRNEDNLQKNIFDHDITVNYGRNRKRQIYIKKTDSKYIKFNIKR